MDCEIAALSVPSLAGFAGSLHALLVAPGEQAVATFRVIVAGREKLQQAPLRGTEMLLGGAGPKE